MSVLINMEMPTSCGQCPLHDEDYRGKEHCDIGWKRIGKAEEKPDWCPLVPVPAHGMLIDRDIVAKDLQEMSESVEKDFPYMDRNDNLMIERGIAFARQYVLNLAPTIIPAEEGE